MKNWKWATESNVGLVSHFIKIMEIELQRYSAKSHSRHMLLSPSRVRFAQNMITCFRELMETPYIFISFSALWFCGERTRCLLILLKVFLIRDCSDVPLLCKLCQTGGVTGERRCKILSSFCVPGFLFMKVLHY